MAAHLWIVRGLSKNLLFQKVAGCIRLLTIACVLGSLPGCYYLQAARGQLEVMHKSEPIADVIESDDTPVGLSERLRLVERARRFSIEQLGLPDNDSYRSYADIEREYVVWNVFAAPEFSLQPKRWCFPIAGCVSYRGYFAIDAARRLAARLQNKGYDVAVGGVSAYSTLGKFDDPVLSTMMRWDDINLVATLFHELAHQVVYLKGDSAFNESFATAVEEFGIERWLRYLGRHEDLLRYQQRRALSGRVMQLVDAARGDLRMYYAETIGSDAKRLLKRHRIERLVDDIRSLYRQARREPPTWLNDLNNARIASMTLYEGNLPAFRALLVECKEELDCFYAQALEIAGLDADSRSSRLQELMASRAAGQSVTVHRESRHRGARFAGPAVHGVVRSPVRDLTRKRLPGRVRSSVNAWPAVPRQAPAQRSAAPPTGGGFRR